MNRRHYLLTEPALGVPLLAMAAAFLVLAQCVVILRATSRTVQVTLASAVLGERPEIGSLPVLTIAGTGEFEFEGRTLRSLGALESALERRAAGGPALVVVAPPGLPAEQLTEVLGRCSRAGFTQILLDTTPLTGED